MAIGIAYLSEVLFWGGILAALSAGLHALTTPVIRTLAVRVTARHRNEFAGGTFAKQSNTTLHNQ